MKGAPIIPPAELNRPIVSVDFDGTLIAETSPFNEIPQGGPLPGVERALVMLSQQFTIMIYTARDTKRVNEWVRKHDLQRLIAGVTNKKPKGHVALFDNSAVPIPHGLLTAVEGWLKQREVTAWKWTNGNLFQYAWFQSTTRRRVDLTLVATLLEAGS